MEYIECQITQGVGYCTDNDCPCTLTEIPQGTGFLFISPEVVTFRKDALSQVDLQAKLKPMIERGEDVSVTRYEPILICEEGAKRRHLDLTIAADDAVLWWKEHKAPLRETPVLSSEAANMPNGTPLAPDDTFTNIKEPDKKHFGQIAQAPHPQKVANPFSGLPAEEEVSDDDVLSQFKGTPLGEMAAKMAGDHMEHASFTTTDTAIPATIIKSREFNDTLDLPAPPPEQRKKRKYKGKRKPIFLIILLSILSIAVIGAVFYLVKYPELFTNQGKKLELVQKVLATTEEEEEFDGTIAFEEEPEPPAPEPVVEKVEVEKVEEPPIVSPPKPEPPAPKPVKENLTQPFFASSYSFRDIQYYGSIFFSNVSSSGGHYSQKVSPMGSTKVYHVKGTFTYSEQRILFQPENAQVDVIWVLEHLNSSAGVAKFFDPKKENRSTAYIDLEVCKTADCL